ncbi:MAG: Do family serine endopeptidase [Nitrospira sp.]|nr:Do family serine endopeptidase [Nitrospira sp.]MDH5193072.1 Do family serine endopeptidase [Nitrospira sp.]
MAPMTSRSACVLSPVPLLILILSLLASVSFVPTVEAVNADSPGIRMLEEIQTVITELAEQAKPSVVNLFPITTAGKLRDASGERMPNASGSGSGLIVNSEGLIVTNNHVIGDATEIEVRFSDKTKLIAQVIGKDPDTDLALLKVPTDRPLPSAPFGDSSGVKVGQWVLAVGNPFGLDRTVTLGVVSGIGRENMNLSRYENFIQTDASINPGNSGGPLFNLRGEVIGINTAIINFAQGIGFAIPSNMAKHVIEQLLAKGKVIRGWLGVGIQPLTADLAKKFGVSEGEGVLVNEVFEKDPAAEAGIRPGDVIVRIDGIIVDSPNKLSRLIGTLTPGASAKIDVIRDLKHLTLAILLTERRDTAAVPTAPHARVEIKLGVEVQELTPSLAERFKLREAKGVVIMRVEPNSLAHAEGLREGDLIKEVNRAETSSLADYTAAISRSRRGDTILLRVLRETRAFYVVLKTSD